MPIKCVPSLAPFGSALVLVLVLAACTPGGQFDPTEVVNIDTKKKLPGDREPLFPNGVPGAATGVPPDLVKGYQPPPEPAAESASAAATPGATAAAAMPEKPKPKLQPKPKPKPKLARAPAQAQSYDSARDKKPAQPAQTNWPAPPGAPPAQTNWPAPPGAPPAQTNWPAPPGASAQQTAQPQSNWPNPPAPGTYSH